MKRQSHGQLGFLAMSGLAGWAALCVFTAWPVGLFRPWQPTVELAACLVLGGLARLLAVRVFDRVRVALDSAVYVSAAFVFGTVPAAWLVLIILTLDDLLRWLRGSGELVRGEGPGHYFIAHLIHSGGLPALVMLAVGLVFGVDDAGSFSDWALTGWLTGFSVVFLLLHYVVAGGSRWIAGTGGRKLWTHFVLNVIVAEFALVPLTLAMVLGYLHQGMGLYLLLGATCLLFNWIYRRAVINATELRERVNELATLEHVGRILSGSLDRTRLLSNIARETLRLVRHTSRFMIGLLEPDREDIRYALFDESGRNYKFIVAPRDEGLSGWVMANQQSLLLSDIQKEYGRYSKSLAYNDPTIHSWLGVPLIVYDEVMGVLSVQSEQQNAYNADQVRVLSSIAEQAAVALENARLYELATVDGLTGLLVRRHFEQRLQEEWSRSRRYDSPFSLGVFDLDNFKNLNDTYGHQAGDQMLRAVASVVRKNMRAADLAGRYGGEEFAFILPRTRLPEALNVAERIRTDIESIELEINAGDKPLRITASIGVAAYPDSCPNDAVQLVALADAAMYRAKSQGKNQVCRSRGGDARPEPLGEVAAMGQSAP